MSLAPRENSWVPFSNFHLPDFVACGLRARHIWKVHFPKSASCPRKTQHFTISVEQFSTKPPLELSKVLRFQRKVPSAASPAAPGLGIASEDLTRRRPPSVWLPNSPSRPRKSIFFRFSKKINSGARFVAAAKENQWFSQISNFLTAFWQNSSLFCCSRQRSVGLHLGHFNLCVGLHSLLKPVILGPENPQNGSAPGILMFLFKNWFLHFSFALPCSSWPSWPPSSRSCGRKTHYLYFSSSAFLRSIVLAQEKAYIITNLYWTQISRIPYFPNTLKCFLQHFHNFIFQKMCSAKSVQWLVKLHFEPIQFY